MTVVTHVQLTGQFKLIVIHIGGQNSELDNPKACVSGYLSHGEQTRIWFCTETGGHNRI